MLSLAILTILASLNTAERPMAIHCQKLAQYVSGCPQYVLGLSDCEQAHRKMCHALLPAKR